MEQLQIDLGVLAGEQHEPAASVIELTDEQQLPVQRRSESILLAAAAGSGKTSVLVERFVRAVREDGIAPGAILAITFTERAAGELRSRVRARLLQLGDRQAARDTEAAFVGTFHGFCARLLRSHPLPAGLDPDFAILDAGQSGRLREVAFERALAAFMEGEPRDAVDLVAAYGADGVRTMIEQAHAELRSRGQRHPRLPARSAAPGAEPLELEAVAALALLDRLLGLFCERYEALKAAGTSLDFDDLELIAGELLAGNRGLRESWSDRFALLMVDEFQDTNPRQLSILQSLARENLFTVGDEFQSIYGFRHADVSLFRGRRDELARSGRSLALTRNFRSRGELLELVNTAFGDRFADFSPLLEGRRDVAAPPSQEPLVELLLTSNQGWEESDAIARSIAAGLPHAASWRQAEARLLAQRVQELVRSGEALPGEIVVLLRATGDIEVFERALQLRGLRTLATVGTFWGRQQIGDLQSYLRALANPRDEEALYSALASPLGGCSRDGLALLAKAAAVGSSPVWETALDVSEQAAPELSDSDRRAVASLCAWLQQERREAPRRGISELIERALAHSGYRAHVLSLDWGERRLANVHKLLRLARSFEAREGRDLRAFVDHVEHLKRAEAVEPEAPVEGVEPDAVRLMTIHAAKGLEFPVVCVADLGRQPVVRSPRLLLDGARVGLRLQRLGDGEVHATLDFEELRGERRRREAEEEDRVLYVAMTRARERLLLSGAVDFESWPKRGEIPPPIQWLGPALCASLPEVGSRGAGVHELAVGDSGAIALRCTLSNPAAYGSILRQPPGPPAVRGDDLGVPGPPQSAARGVDPVTRPGPTREDPREEPAPALPATLSYTSLSLLERCGYRYYLERVLGMPEERAAQDGSAAAGLDARARGVLVHRLMETWEPSRGAPPDADRVAAVASELGLEPAAREREEIAGLIARAMRAPLGARIGAARRQHREHPFAFSLGDGAPLVTGVIDLLCEEPDGTALIVDYKSDRLAAEADPQELVARDYAVQRLLYALAVLREGALAAEVVHWFLERPHEPAVARYTLAELATLEDQLARRLAGAWAEPFAVSPQPHRGLCLTCPGRGGMCSWGEEHTMREDPGAS